MLGPLERANLNYWAVVRIPDDGQSSKPSNSKCEPSHYEMFSNLLLLPPSKIQLVLSKLSSDKFYL
jgi:hypothetical protein